MSEKRPWYVGEAEAVVPSAIIHHYRGLYIPDTSLSSPEGEPWPSEAGFQRRLSRLLLEYAFLCELAGSVFPIVRAYQLTGHPLHVDGWALDVCPVEGWTVARMASVCRERWRMPDSRLWGVGMCPEWLHMDVRPRRCRSDWTTRNSHAAY